MNICVFCGSSPGIHSIYAAEARNLGKLLVQGNASLIYGGGNVGLMGILADAVMAQGGTVHGVIPDFLVKREVAHRQISTLEVVASMHERKKIMADLADAFIAMPGGWGTLDELAEILTWRQLSLTSQPVGLLNINGFFDSLLAQMQTMAAEGFLAQSNLDMLCVDPSPATLLTRLGVKF